MSLTPPLFTATNQAITLIDAARALPATEIGGVPAVIWEMLATIEANLNAAITTTDLRIEDNERWRAGNLARIEAAGGLHDPRIGRILVHLFARDGIELLSDIAVSRLADALDGPTLVG